MEDALPRAEDTEIDRSEVFGFAIGKLPSRQSRRPGLGPCSRSDFGNKVLFSNPPGNCLAKVDGSNGSPFGERLHTHPFLGRVAGH